MIYRSGTNAADPNWSPDGNSLVFGENSLNNQGSAVFVLDLKTRKATKLPGSDGLYSPRWSPDGRYIAAITLDSLKLMLFDCTAQKWTELANIFVAYPTWSRDARYLYFDGILDNQESYFRVQVSDRKLERLFSLKGFQAAGEPLETGPASRRTELRCLSGMPASRRSTLSMWRCPNLLSPQPVRPSSFSARRE